MMCKLLSILIMVMMSSGNVSAQVPAAQFYELADAILESLRPQAISAVKKGRNGYYYWRNAPTDTVTVSLLLLNRAYDDRATEKILLANQGTEEYEALRKYFSAQDISAFRRQLPKSRNFTFAQSNLRQNWVHVISQDTLRAIDARMLRQFALEAQNQRDAYLLKKYGAWQLYSISGMLFSLDGKKAIVEVGFGYGVDIWIYQKIKGQWHRKASVYSVIG